MSQFLTFIFAIALGSSAFAQDSASGAAKSSAVQGLLTAGTNVATGVMMYTMCKAPTNPQPMLCVMGALSMANAAADLLTSKTSKSAAQSLLPGGVADWDTVDLGGGLNGNGLNGAQFDAKFSDIESQINNAKADLAKQGVDLEKGTIKTPKGVKPIGALGSGKALADAGLISADQIGEADEIIKKNNAKLQQIALQTSPGGGGGGGSSKAVKYEYQAPDYGSMFGDKEKPAAPQVAGLVKTIDGQPYGASINNIFDMIRNRYEIKTKEKFFVDK
jgi:hypothetical protein